MHTSTGGEAAAKPGWYWRYHPSYPLNSAAMPLCMAATSASAAAVEVAGGKVRAALRTRSPAASSFRLAGLALYCTAVTASLPGRQFDRPPLLSKAACHLCAIAAMAFGRDCVRAHENCHTGRVHGRVIIPLILPMGTCKGNSMLPVTPGLT